ncbi:MAG: nucleotide-binding protein [Leptothrix sp. (in: Bacteria)]|nr:nucleotide-binding protein [Leptothrix sp. (in: b-proteobacteria)]
MFAGLALALAIALPLPATAQAANTLQGEVLEVLNVEGYTYLRLKTRGGEAWAAVVSTALSKGAQVSIANASLMENFESKTLKRRFEKIYFGQLAGPGANAGPKVAGGAAPATNAGLPGAMHTPGKAAPAAPAVAAVSTAPVPKAQGKDARTVAEVVAGKAGLKDKPVLVRARVVKVSNGIMGKNWLHLQDGSGKAQDGSNDLLVTSKDSAALGDVVTVRGVVRTDVTVGAGYAYAVLVEDATLSK